MAPASSSCSRDPSRSASRARDTPSGFMRCCTGWAMRSSSAMPRRSGRWWSARRRPTGVTPLIFWTSSGTTDSRPCGSRIPQCATSARSSPIACGLCECGRWSRMGCTPSPSTRAGVAQLQALSLPPYTSCRRSESLELLRWLDTHIKGLDDQIEEAAHAHPEAQRLMTHPGVGPLSALATVLVLGSVIRFPTSKHVVSYVGLAPAIESSAGKHRLGRITKQGNALLRYVLGQAGQAAIKRDPDLRRLYYAVLHRRGRSRAKIAVARKLLVRLYVMLRDQIDYQTFLYRAPAAARRKEMMPTTP